MIHITKSGFKCFEWDGGLRQNVEQTDVMLAGHLRDGVVLVEDGVTLEDVITFTALDESLETFVGAYAGCKVMDLYNELKQNVKPPALDNDIQYCTVTVEVEVWPATKHNKEKQLQVTYDFHGRGNDNQKWALDLAPLGEIAVLPFRLESSASVQYLDAEPYETVDGLDFTPSLLEILDAIFSDLSFHGDEAEKAARREKLAQQVKAINDGTAKLIPLDLEETEE